ncbi:MAG: hypothetical protein AB7P76_06770 [Candidatus Melainabacteria bacterium]
MTDSLQELSLMERDNTLNPRQLRKAGFVPGTLNNGGEPQNIQTKAHALELMLLKGQREFQLTGAGFSGKARVLQLQVDPVSHSVLNIELTLQEAAPKKASKGQPKAKAEKQHAGAPRLDADGSAPEAAEATENETALV